MLCPPILTIKFVGKNAYELVVIKGTAIVLIVIVVIEVAVVVFVVVIEAVAVAFAVVGTNRIRLSRLSTFIPITYSVTESPNEQKDSVLAYTYSHSYLYSRDKSPKSVLSSGGDVGFLMSV